jgi:hypothetical protein
MKKFKAIPFTSEIREVEISRETEKYVIIGTGKYPDGEKEAKQTEWYAYNGTWQEAHQFLIDREKTAIVDLLAKVKRHQETLSKLQEMSQP